MNHPNLFTTTTHPLPKSVNRSPVRCGLFFITVAVACFALSSAPNAFGVTPAPDGGYPNQNTAEGTDALKSLTSSPFANTAIGFQALFSDTTAEFNTAIGSRALQSNTTGCCNAATGSSALVSNTTGAGNTATGVDALFSNTSGGSNTAIGIGVLERNTTGNNNTATGIGALGFNTNGNNNTAEGAGALLNSTGSNNIALGTNAGSSLTTGNNNIDIGAPGVAGESNTIRIGRVGVHKSAYLRGISGATVASGVTVIVDTNGHLGTVQSSARFKDEIKPMDKTSEAILALKPVTFRYKKDLDPEGIPQFGLVAEEVEKVNPDLVARDEDGKVTTVRYEAVNAMLLNEFLKEHHKVEEQDRKIRAQEATITQLRNEMATVVARLKKQDSKIQKVSDQLELNKFATRRIRRGGSALQVAANNH
jgi:hypothetical protein